jgi:hypothetical protein
MTDMAKITISFTQKVSEAAYETADYSLSIERSVPESLGDEGILVEATSLFEQVKSEVLKQAGQEWDLTPDGVVMRRLKSGVPRTGSSNASPVQAAPVSNQAGPTASSVAAPAGVPQQSGAKMSGRTYKRTDFCVGGDADTRQAAWNLLAFQPPEWDDNGNSLKVYEVKEKADGTTDVTKAGKNFPNFSVSKDALIRLGFQPQRDVGIWINDGDSNIPIRVWDQASGQNKQEAVEFDWTERRRELQQFAYKGK